MEAFCYMDGIIKTFRVDRIISARASHGGS